MSENEKMPANENEHDDNALTDESLEGASGGIDLSEAFKNVGVWDGEPHYIRSTQGVPSTETLIKW